MKTRRSNFLFRLLLPAVMAMLPMLVLSGGMAQATANYEVRVATPAPTKPEMLLLKVYFRSIAERDRLATELGAEEVPTTDGFLTILGDRQMVSTLQARGLRVEIDEAESKRLNNPNLFGQNSPDTFYGGYKTVEEMQAFLDAQVAAHPGLAVKFDFGDSWCKTHPGACTLPAPTSNGYDLLALHITNQAIPGPKPVFWYDAGIHSREIATPEVAMRFISWLLDNYNTSAEAHWLVDWHDIYVVPVLNPDGHHIVEQGPSQPYYQRKNGDRDDGCTTYPPSSSNQFGTDLNRNFPFQWACCGGSQSGACNETYHGPSAGSEEETRAVTNTIRSLIPDQRGPNISDPASITTTGIVQSMHSYANLNLYPWGYTTQPAPNGPDMANVSAHMSAAGAYPPGNNYQFCQPPNCLYAVDGDSTTWAYGELGIPAITTELEGGSFFPAYSQVDQIFNNNRGMLTYMAKVARAPYLLTHGPDAANMPTAPLTATMGSTVQLAGTINYAWASNAFSQNVGAAEYYVDTPPWAGGTAQPMQATDGSYNSPTEGVQAGLDTTGLSLGRHIVFVRGRGAGDYSGYPTWGPVTAVFVDVVQGGGTSTVTVIGTATSTATAVSSITASVTGTAFATSTATAQTNSTASPTACPIQFQDVAAANTFYPYVRCLACRNILGGYQCGGVGEPCDTSGNPYFRPGVEISRGQIAKIVSQSAGLNDAPGSQIYEDVPTGSPFFLYIQRLSNRGYMGGYPCGQLSTETCIAPGNRPYFRPSSNATRGQLSKIVSNAAGFTEDVIGQYYTDVPRDTPFYPFIQRLNALGVMGGYPCDGVGEPCDAQNRPYFRPNADVTRGQASKIVANTFFPTCRTPAQPQRKV